MNMFAICQADCVSEQGFKRIQQQTAAFIMNIQQRGNMILNDYKALMNCIDLNTIRKEKYIALRSQTTVDDIKTRAVPFLSMTDGVQELILKSKFQQAERFMNSMESPHVLRTPKKLF